MKKDIFKLIAAIIICQLAGIIGAVFTGPSIPTWYTSLNKPAFNPPAWLFGPVWTLLYLLMGIALYFVWLSPKKQAIGWFIIQLGLNVLWSLIFFGFRAPLFALIEIIFLWYAILFTIIWFYKVSRVAAYLLVPYLLWVSFACVLNLAIVLLN